MKTIAKLVGVTLFAVPPLFGASHGGSGGFGGGGGHVGGNGGRAVAGGGFHPGVSGNTAFYYSRSMHGGSMPSRYPEGQMRPPLPRPHVFNGPNRSATNSAVNSHPLTRNPAAASVARQSSTRPIANTRSDHVFARHDSNWHSDWDRRHVHFSHGHFFVFDNGFWLGLDGGIYPWNYYPYEAYDYYPYDYYPGYYAGTEPYYYEEGGYSAEPLPDPTVSAVQTQLARLGYYKGPVDGIFGASTRDAVANYQIAQQLEVTGSLSAQTLQSLAVPQPPAS